VRPTDADADGILDMYVYGDGVAVARCIGVDDGDGVADRDVVGDANT
jgi:hypothetical protein